jgi:tetratricopeptide (TPR) repeat protein
MEHFLKIKTIGLYFVFMAFSIGLSAQSAAVNAFKQSYVHEKNGDFKKAVDELKKVYDENSYEINLRLGWLNYQAGVFTESVSHYQKAVNLMPYSEEAKFGLILPKAATGKWDEVTAIYQKILANSPNNTVANYRLGLIYYGKKEYDQAFKHFEKVVNLYPFDYDGLIMFAWTNLQMGKTREAKVLFNKVLLYSPDDKSATEGFKLIK